MDSLRTELIETQKTRSDLLKWKLLIVAGIGGAALGFSGEGGGNAHLALAVIPLACFYVDLLCRHLSLRNKAIGKFIASGRASSPGLREYEKYYEVVSGKVWSRVSFESVAMIGCTVFLSVAIVPVGILASGADPSWSPGSWPAALFYGAGLLGVVLSMVLQARYQRAKRGVEELSVPPPSSV